MEKVGYSLGLSYTNALLQGLIHHVRHLISHARQHVGVGVKGDGYGGVTEELLDDLGMHALTKKQRGARVTEVVEASLLRQAGPLEDPQEGAAGQRPGAHGLARMAREDETMILISHAPPVPVGDERKARRKPRKDKDFCDSRCRQNYHYHKRVKRGR